EIAFADDVNTRTGFDVLREKFAEHDLFSEEFGADRDSGLRGLATGRKEINESHRQHDVKEVTQKPAKVRGHCTGRTRTFGDCERGLHLRYAEAALKKAEQAISEQGEGGCGNCAGKNDGITNHSDAAEDEFAETTGANRRGNGGDTDSDDRC